MALIRWRERRTLFFVDGPEVDVTSAYRQDVSSEWAASPPIEVPLDGRIALLDRLRHEDLVHAGGPPRNEAANSSAMWAGPGVLVGADRHPADRSPVPIMGRAFWTGPDGASGRQNLAVADTGTGRLVDPLSVQAPLP